MANNMKKTAHSQSTNNQSTHEKKSEAGKKGAEATHGKNKSASSSSSKSNSRS